VTTTSDVVVLAAEDGWHVRDLRRAADRLGVRLESAPFPTVTGRVGIDGAARIEAGGVDLTATEAVLVRTMPPGSLEQVVFRMDALHRLEAAGVRVINPPRAVEAAVDKYLALAKLEAAGLPVPSTWAGESARAALEAFEALGGDVVVKPLFGSEGRGLVRVSDPELARRAFHTLERLNTILYLQEFISSPGHDVRVFVARGRALGAVRRASGNGDWRTNVAVGGRLEPIGLEPAVERLALRAAEAVGAVVAGIDLLFDTGRGRRVVLEVNAAPGWRSFARTTTIDVASAVLQAALD